MIVVNARGEIDPANLPALREGIAIMEAASRAEDGCQDYTFSIEINNEAVVRITEKWDTLDHLMAHFQTPHMADFQALLAQYPLLNMEANFYEAEAFTPPGF